MTTEYGTSYDILCKLFAWKGFVGKYNLDGDNLSKELERYSFPLGMGELPWNKYFGYLPPNSIGSVDDPINQRDDILLLLNDVVSE